MLLESKIERLIRWFMHHPLLLGLLSLAWLIMRSGTRPHRLTYPCQRAALAYSAILIAPVFSIFNYFLKELRLLVRRRSVIIILITVLATASFLMFYWNTVNKPIQQKPLLKLSPQTATIHPASEIFVVNGSIAKLVNLMGSKGLFFYDSQLVDVNSGPGGLIKRDDVVLIKVNCQWDQRGGTNTDLLKELIDLILKHPEGFIGEIVVADNGQGRGSLNWKKNNAVNESQSVEAIVALYSDKHKVSTYLWDTIASKQVKEYIDGDLQDGYVVSPVSDPETGVKVSYPKFRTKIGTYISFKHGIWDPESGTYDSSRLKVINFPVLKTHSIYGVTGAVKHYMGVVSQPLTDTHSLIGRGALGKVMAETRIPVLNILDAVWVNAIPRNGPATSYEEAIETDLIMASIDPVALDYWASKQVLLQLARLMNYRYSESVDPDNDTSDFGNYLKKSLEQLKTAGYDFTMDANRITVYIADYG
ncbi:MAG: DUF362 domain-containing protein [Thermoproteota archaeon]